jgi:nitrate reductase (cytochrome), electron transfer subunit
MKSLTKIMAAALVGVFMTALPAANDAQAQEEGTLSLRGDYALNEAAPLADTKRQNTSGKMGRAYRQQPPLIPHRMEKYQINGKINQCLRCHDWPYSNEEGAPKVSETHYFNRNGVALDTVSGTRWFCTQCHVPQVQGRALVRNKFKNASEVD